MGGLHPMTGALTDKRGEERTRGEGPGKTETEMGVVPP